MSKSSMLYMWYIIMLSVCIDQGDGRWKERDKAIIQHDIVAYKKIAEKLEREIEVFYDEYPKEWFKGDNVDRIHYKYLTNILNRNTGITKKNEDTDTRKPTFPFVVGGTDIMGTESTMKSRKSIQSASNNKSSWPSFQEILLAMGRKYDWKNDRWIKVKQKLKSTGIVQIQDDGVRNREIHKFSYRIVKLNKSKNRRNVVVAVSAVR